MKNLLSYLMVAFFLFATSLIAQENFTVDGKQLSLKTEVDGTITLLWNTIDNEYRYFIKKGETITELKNTRVDGKYQEEYKLVLQSLTNDESVSVEKINLTTSSLKLFFVEYNKLKDSNFKSDTKALKLKVCLGAFAGITNVTRNSVNSGNESLPLIGFDFEIIDNNHLNRHALVLQFKQVFENSVFKYSSSEFSFNYRFKFVKTQKLDVFINMKFANYISVTDLNYDDDDLPVSDELETESDFQFHINFGLGADYKLGNGYLTFAYNDIISFTQDSNGEFPLDFTLGYKFNL